MSLRSLLTGAATRINTAVLWVLTAVFLTAAGLGIRTHAEQMRAMREQGLPLAASIAPLERRAALLKEEVQLSELQKQIQTGSNEERLRMSVLPDTLDRGKIMALFDTLRQSLESKNLLRPGEVVSIGTPEAGEGGLSAVPIHVTLTLNAEGLRIFTTFMRLTGLLTVGDALPKDGLTSLLHILEASNPADIVALEQFLSTDLGTYGENARVYEDRLLQSVTAPSFIDTFHSVLKNSLLPEAQEILHGDLGAALRSRGLMPSPWISVQQITLKPLADADWQEVTVEMETYIRK